MPRENDYLRAYLYDHRLRNHFITHVLYLLMCVLITNKVLTYFGLHYLFPSKIDFIMVLNFILSGQILIPLLVFIMTTISFHSVKTALLNIVVSRLIKMKFHDAHGFVVWIGLFREWFVQNGKVYQKGKRYGSFKLLLADLTNEKFSLVDFSGISNTLLAASTLNIFLYKRQATPIVVLEVLMIVFFLFNTYNYILLYKISEFQEEFESISRILES